jgi:hypothetical protein
MIRFQVARPKCGGKVTSPSADCESSILVAEGLERGKRGRPLAPRLETCNIVGHTPGVEPATYMICNDEVRLCSSDYGANGRYSCVPACSN